MKDVNELKRTKATLIESARTFDTECTKEGRAMTGEELEKYQKMVDDIRSMEQTIKREEELQEMEMRGGTPGVVADPPAEEKRTFASLGDQLLAVVRASQHGATPDPRLLEIRAATGLGEAVDSEGGFLVQKDFIAELVKDTYDTTVVAKTCKKIPISANANGTKMNGIDETSRADGSRWGGIRAYWANEADEKTASKPKFRRIELNLNKLIGLCYATDENLQDAAQLESIIRDGFREEFGFKIDDAVINGDGAGKPLGVLAAGCLVSQAKETGQAAATVVAENVIKMWSRLMARSKPKAVWLINSEITPQLYTMSLAVGTGGIPVYMPANGLSGSPYGILFGRPVIEIEQCQALGTVGDIILGDFSQYLLADKGNIQEAQSIHVRFIYDESVFRFVYRVDGQPVRSSALTPYKGSNDISHFVALATRS